MLDKPSNFIPKGRYKEIKGDASIPESAGNRYILIPVSNSGAIEKNASHTRWQSAASDYKLWFRMSYGTFEKSMGQVRSVQVQSDTNVINMLCLNGKEIDYDAVKKCFDAAGKEAGSNNGSIHINKFGDWEQIQPLIDELFLKRGLLVNAYST